VRGAGATGRVQQQTAAGFRREGAAIAKRVAREVRYSGRQRDREPCASFCALLDGRVGPAAASKHVLYVVAHSWRDRGLTSIRGVGMEDIGGAAFHQKERTAMPAEVHSVVKPRLADVLRKWNRMVDPASSLSL